nr:hypothetical protein [Tanacetum cinerariifolium]
MVEKLHLEEAHDKSQGKAPSKPRLLILRMCYRRLGHVNFRSMNKLVKGNLVRGLPSKGTGDQASYKTPYELLTGDKPSISYLKPFSYHVTILNTSDPLGKFDKKSDEGYIVGYSISSKAYRVYNLVSRKIEETMNLKFLENKPFVTGTGQAWMFDIDYLTDSLNYSRVSSTNLTAGSQGATPSNAEEPTTVAQALADLDLVEAMQAEMQQFRNQKVWVLVTLPDGKRAIGTKWILKNKKDAKGIVYRNKARIEVIRLFLAFASFIRFMVYQMDVKSAFLYGKIAEEKYVADILKKFDLDNSKLASTPFEPEKIRQKNVPDEPISVHLYRSMIGCLMYLTATKPDIMFAVCAVVRHQVTPKTSNLLSVKRIFKYLTAYPKLGLWYPRDSPFDLEAFSDGDYAGANGDKKSTIGGCQFLGRRLISWQCKKQTIVSTSSCEAEYVAAASCCGQWFLFTSAGRVTFCSLFPIPAGVLVSAGHMLFLLEMYFSCWYMTVTAASEVSLLDGVKGLVATIDGTVYTVTEASIRSALQLDDLNAIDTMTSEEIFAGLRDIGYTTEGKFTYFKNKFSPQWKFLIHTLIHCLSPKSEQAQQKDVYQPQPSLVVAPHPSPDPMPSPPRQSSPPPIPFETLEAELKATRLLHKDTVVLFAKRIKKLESKLKSKKRKLVLSDSENEEEARQS